MKERKPKVLIEGCLRIGNTGRTITRTRLTRIGRHWDRKRNGKLTRRDIAVLRQGEEKTNAEKGNVVTTRHIQKDALGIKTILVGEWMSPLFQKTREEGRRYLAGTLASSKVAWNKWQVKKSGGKEAALSPL